MLFSVEQASVGRDEKRAPLKTPAWEARISLKLYSYFRLRSIESTLNWMSVLFVGAEREAERYD